MLTVFSRKPPLSVFCIGNSNTSARGFAATFGGAVGIVVTSKKYCSGCICITNTKYRIIPYLTIPHFAADEVLSRHRCIGFPMTHIRGMSESDPGKVGEHRKIRQQSSSTFPLVIQLRGAIDWMSVLDRRSWMGSSCPLGPPDPSFVCCRSENSEGMKRFSEKSRTV